MSFTEKSWYRRTVMTAAGLVVLALVVLTAARVVGRPAGSGTIEAVSTRVEAMARFEDPPIPDQNNAARWLEAGAAAIVWSDAEMAAIGTASKMPFDQWSQELEAKIRQALDRQGGALATLHRALEAEQTSFGIPYSEGIDLELPELLPLLRAARLLLTEARVSFADGDEGRGLEALATMNRMATALEGERTLITALVGIAVDRMVLVAAAEAVASPEPLTWQEDFLTGLEEVTEGFDTRTMFERVSEAWSTMLCRYVTSGPRVFENRNGETVEFTQDCRCNEIESAAARVMELIDLPYGESGDAFAALTDGMTCGAGSLHDIEGFAKAVARAQSVDAQRQLLYALVAMRRLGNETGAYPSARPDLVLLSDPDPFTGEKISYTLNPDRSLTLALVGVGELLKPITVAGMDKIVVPVTLPAPGP